MTKHERLRSSYKLFFFWLFSFLFPFPRKSTWIEQQKKKGLPKRVLRRLSTQQKANKSVVCLSFIVSSETPYVKKKGVNVRPDQTRVPICLIAGFHALGDELCCV